MSRVYSLSEVEATCKMAAKGSGYNWGEAEAVGKMVRQLAQYDINVIKILIGIFRSQSFEKRDPVKLACCISDNIQYLLTRPMKYENISFPVLLLPSLIWGSLWLKNVISIEVDGEVAYASSHGLSIDQDFLKVKRASQVCIKLSHEKCHWSHPSFRGLSVDQQQWDNLLEYASNCFAPETDDSRKDAGE